MNQEFVDYVKGHIKEYLPASYEDAIVETHLVRKANGQNLIALNVRNSLSRGMFSIYLNKYEEKKNQGTSLEKVMAEIGQEVMMTSNFDADQYASQIDSITEYEKMKPMLALRLCDPVKSEEFLKDKPFKNFGNLAITYRVQLFTGMQGIQSAVVDNTLLGLWGVSKGKLHKDALKAEAQRSPLMLYETPFIASEKTIPKLFEDSRNLFYRPKPIRKIKPLYTLSNVQQTNGACAIVQPGVLDRIGAILRRNFYILPSSIHEFMIAPENGHMRLHDYDKMVKDINSKYIEINDVLSDKAMYYNRKTKKLKFHK